MWEDLWKNYPDLFEKALQLDNVAVAKTTGNKLRLLPSGTPIQVLKERFESKGGDLFPDYDFEELTPCMCLT